MRFRGILRSVSAAYGTIKTVRSVLRAIHFIANLTECISTLYIRIVCTLIVPVAPDDAFLHGWVQPSPLSCPHSVS